MGAGSLLLRAQLEREAYEAEVARLASDLLKARQEVGGWVGWGGARPWVVTGQP